MIYGPLNGKMAEFEYDCRNRLVSAGGISYEYDAENNRISQTENGAKTEYVVDSNSSSLTRILTAEKEGDTTYYIYGIGLIAQENGNEYMIYHFNNIGSTEAVTNIDGEIVETFDYGPYGELLSENKCSIMFLYSGELGVATDSNGLYYMRARYYNPEIKRFINQDVMTGSITDTPTLNRYAYVNGNPISLNDPFGLSPFLNWLDGITGHDILDLLGMLPGIGFVFDGINAAWYAQEGDYYNAACSLVSALPGAGDALGVFAKTGKSCKLVTAFHKTGSAGNLMIGSYELGKTADKYISGDASFTWEEIKGDLFKVAMTGTSMWGSAKDFGTSYCFVAGTLVTTEDGQEPIEEIEVGDKVLSENEMTGEVVLKEVYATSVSETNEFYHIHVNDEEIVATGTHPFYVYKFGWTTARALRAGDVLVLSNGELVTVEWIDHEILESPIYVYNFEVEDFHTYFVGKSGILVHNGKKCTSVDSVDYNDDNVTVGRWMNEGEYNKMVATKEIQPSPNNPQVKHVAYPSDPNAFGRQAPNGSLYVEFDIPSGSVKSAGSGWGRIPGPGSPESRLSQSRGNGVINYPKVSNIRKVGSK